MVRFAVTGVLLFLALPCARADEVNNSAVDVAFRDMYNLQFDAAHSVLGEWQRTHTQDPVAPVADAAAYLFSELTRLHVMEVEFFAEDKSFETDKRLEPDPAVRQKFFAELDRASQLSSAALARNANDADAMFASVMVLGLRSDYASLIEKRNLQSLSFMKQARTEAEHLLAIDPARFDAYLALGVENYVLSLKPAPLRWMLRLDGARTDKTTGIERLRVVAEKGRYLRPFARLLLAVAAVRDKDAATARQILSALAQQFPNNPLYAKELHNLSEHGADTAPASSR